MNEPDAQPGQAPPPQHPPARVAIGLGANLGDRRAALQTAIDVFGRDPQVTLVAVSPLYETDPIGGPEQPDYLNAVLLIDTPLEAVEVLALAQLAEAELGRTREVRWGARTLDVDVLAYGQVVSDDPALTLPHPRAHERAFVLIPWCDLSPDFTIARVGKTVGELADALSPEDALAVRPAHLAPPSLH